MRIMENTEQSENKKPDVNSQTTSTVTPPYQYVSYNSQVHEEEEQFQEIAVTSLGWPLKLLIVAHLSGFAVGTTWAILSWGLDDVNVVGIFISMSIVTLIPALIVALIIAILSKYLHSRVAEKLFRLIWIAVVAIVFIFEALVIQPLSDPNLE